MKISDDIRWPRLLAALLLGMLSLGAVSCGDESASDKLAKVRGRLVKQPAVPLHGSPAPAPSLAGTTVVLGRLRTDGTIEVVSREAAPVDAQGRFVLETDLDGVGGLVVQATQGEHVLRAIVTAEVERGETVDSPPLDVETTVEAGVYARVLDRGSAEVVSASDITLFVDPALAAEVQADTQALERLTTAIEQASRARRALLAADPFGLSSKQIGQLGESRDKARTFLESALNAAIDDEAIELAYAGYARAEARAYAEAGIGSDLYARERTVTSQALIVAGAPLPAGARAALARSAAVVEARALTLGIESEWESLGAGQSKLLAIDQAGTTLILSLRAATNGPPLDAAFDAYHDSAVEGLQALLPVQEQAVADADLAINAPAGPRLQLQTRLGQALTTEAVLSSYSAFFAGVTLIATGELPGLGGASFDAALSALTMINMNVAG